jgi:hypothetical protein
LVAFMVSDQFTSSWCVVLPLQPLRPRFSTTLMNWPWFWQDMVVCCGCRKCRYLSLKLAVVAWLVASPAPCRTARYCCKNCQLQHLKAHRPVCKRIAGQESSTRQA